MILVDVVGKQELFQSVVGLSMTAGIFAALEAIRVTFEFLGVLACGACGSGERFMGMVTSSK